MGSIESRIILDCVQEAVRALAADTLQWMDLLAHWHEGKEGASVRNRQLLFPRIVFRREGQVTEIPRRAGVERQPRQNKAFTLLGCLLFATWLTACGGPGTELEVTVPENSFTFEPVELTAPSGSEVTISFTNQDRRLHDLAIVRGVFDDEEAARNATETDPDIVVGITDLLRQEESDTLTVTFDEPGTYQFFCRFVGHFRVGMRGTITVEG